MDALILPGHAKSYVSMQSRFGTIAKKSEILINYVENEGQLDWRFFVQFERFKPLDDF